MSIPQPSFISSVIILPPKGTTAVWRIIPSLKIATSVVPPPISTNTTPASFSSSLNTALAEAIGSKVRPMGFRCAISTQRVIPLIALTCPITK